MAIDMGESLGASWLKHVKECFVVQTDWKTSRSWQKKHTDQIAKITKGVAKLFRERYSATIFKDNKNVEQIERQAECDIIGISREKSGAYRYHVLEVAVHTKRPGLHYSGTKGGKRTDVSDDKVVAKLFNAAMMLYANLDVTSAEIVFATPLVDEKLKKRIVARLHDLQDFLSHIESEKGGKFAYRFSFIGNEDFATKILEPTCRVGMESSDVSEYFLRAMMICEIAKGKSSRGIKTVHVRGAVKEKPATALGGVKPARDKTMHQPNQVQLILTPADIVAFKRELLNTRHAQRIITYANGRQEITTWDASKIRPETDILNNIKSAPFWRHRFERGITRVEITVLK